ncbi:MAG: hypothetical protein EPO21_11915 [Chloroflexota bacterium]|nr:MAG: hypothetical protein EPO21_11915 [Chloroflexota bacterium]
MSSKRFLKIEPELCIADTGCRECVISCPDSALRVVDGLPRVVRVASCDEDDACVESCTELCPTGAVKRGG